MDFVNKAYAQAAEVFGSMSLGAKITSGLLLGVIVVSLLFLFSYEDSSDGEFLFGGQEFSQSELSAMQKAFAKAGLNEGQIEGFRMKVPRAQRATYINAINEDGMQLRRAGGFKEQAILGASGPFVTRQQREMMNKNAIEQELAFVVANMRDEEASVQIDELKTGGFQANIERTALVAVKTYGGKPIDPSRVKAIRDTVAGGIAGMKAESVTVTDMDTGMAYPGVNGDGSALAGESAYATHKAQYESFWREKILRRLSTIPGVNVEVNVELDPQLRKEAVSRRVEANPVSLSTTDRSKTETTRSSTPAGRPGAVPNGVASNQSASVSAGPSTESEKSETDFQQEFAPSTENTVIATAPLVPNRVTASIDVPQSYFTKIWRQKNPPAEGAEPVDPDPLEVKKIEDETVAKIENAVVGLLPSVPAGTDPYPQVVVTTYTDLPVTALQPPGIADKATSWFAANYQTVGLFVLGIISLVMLRSMLTSKAGASSDASIELDLPVVETTEQIEEEETPPVRKFDGDGEDLRSELSEMVAGDPDTAANILGKWIGDAA